MSTPATTKSRGGRGARARIAQAAAELFYTNGIHATGVELIAARAGVSKRTLYQHFPGKYDLVAHYLQAIHAAGGTMLEQRLDDQRLPARERLLAIFDFAADPQIIRGCPFHNAAVESAGALSGTDDIVRAHKRDFVRRLAAVAEEAGLSEPGPIAAQLATLFEGATALATSLNDRAPYRHARQAAATLVDAAPRVGGPAVRPGNPGTR